MADRKPTSRKGRKTAQAKPGAAPKPDVSAKPAAAAAKLPARPDLGIGEWPRNHPRQAAAQPRGARKQPQQQRAGKGKRS
jgi:hypothetical protein